ncbi:MAG: PQQ-dependent sugar dehydrogenase [Acidobacteria bacterium]|jgi:hypothetical protein|nr:PQQ-dependent sugar dehydrogenase [Acidobacteriota bacterium]
MSRSHSIPFVAAAAAFSLFSHAHAQVEASDPCLGIAPSPSVTLKSVAVVTGLVNRPLFVTSAPGDPNRLFVVQQDGYVMIKKRGAATNSVTTFLDIHTRVSAAGSEMGLLGLAFDPDYATTRFLYVDYTESVGSVPFTVVARYETSPTNPDVALATETRIMRFQQPETNHNGGQLQFGPDGYLYVSTGDGGGSGDQHGLCGNGQNPGVLLGKMLRIDVRSLPGSVAPECGGTGSSYRVPPTNPFVGRTGCDEIWALGLRNPWRSSFDALTGELYIADVGQGCWEEVDIAPSGAAAANYGWRENEGNHCFNNASGDCNNAPPTTGCSRTCNDPSFTKPKLEYAHSGGACSITGGYVYRGCRMPDLRGTYFYGDYCTGDVKTFRYVAGLVTNPLDLTAQLDPTNALASNLTSFGVDAQNEIYITRRAGTVLKVLPVFTALEVSGAGAGTEFLLGPAVWSWEDLQYSTDHPVSLYRIYRGLPGGVFTCIFKTTGTSWTGDLFKPLPGQQYAYLVTALSPDNQETSSGSPPRTLSPTACP